MQLTLAASPQIACTGSAASARRSATLPPPEAGTRLAGTRRVTRKFERHRATGRTLNNIPAPYMVERFNALSERARVEFETWSSSPTEAGRSRSVDESAWKFTYWFVPRLPFGRCIPVLTPLAGPMFPRLDGMPTVVPMGARSALRCGTDPSRIIYIPHVVDAGRLAHACSPTLVGGASRSGARSACRASRSSTSAGCLRRRDEGPTTDVRLGAARRSDGTKVAVILATSGSRESVGRRRPVSR
jgi:hypothetical protein